jgi:signal transduction histidine kinase
MVHRLLPVLALALNLVLLATALASDARNRGKRTFAAVAASLALWNGAVFGLRSTTDPGVALYWERVVHVAVALMPAFFYHYVIAFLNRSARRASVVTAYALALAFITAVPTAWFMSGVRRTPWGFAPVAGPLYAPFLVYFDAYLVLGLAALIRASSRAQPGFRRKRARWMVAGVLVSLAGGLVDFARFTLGWEALYPVGIPANALFALVLGVAVVRYRLMDIGIAVRRAVLYGLASLALAPLVFVTVHLTADFRGRFAGLATPAAAVAIIALALPLLRKLEHLLDRLIFQRQHGVRDTLVRLANSMPAIMDVPRLAAALTQDLLTDVPVRHAHLYMRDGDGDAFSVFAGHTAPEDDIETLPQPTLDAALVLWLRRHRRPLVLEDAVFRATADGSMEATARALETAHVAVALPILDGERMQAVLLIGEKQSGYDFDPDEVELLQALSGSAAIALKNARLYDDLRRRLDELQSTQEQLLQSAKLAAIGELASSVAHEVNNPLMVIMSYSGLLNRQLNGMPGVQSRLQAIEEQSHRAAKIIRDLLDFARRREPRHEAIDVGDVIDRSLQLVGGRLSAADVVADAEILGPLPSIVGDRDQLTQVFVNLLTNAVDAMPDGGSVRVRTDVRTVRGIACLSVSVSDTGVGMTPEQIEQAFRPFYTTKAEGRGTGLGLPISAGIVAGHDGTLETFSEPGKGTTFVVSLPVAAAAA